MSVAPDGRRAAGAHAAWGSRGAGAGAGGGEAALGPGGGRAGAELLRSGARRVLAASVLTTLGVVNLVVDSSSIEVSRRARRAKTDRLDGEKLLRLLLRHWGGERDMWHVVHVPSREARRCAARESGADDAAGGADALSESDSQSAGAARGRAAADGCAVSRATRGGTRLGGRRRYRRACRRGCSRRGVCCRRWRRNGSRRGARNDSRSRDGGGATVGAAAGAAARRRGARVRRSWREELFSRDCAIARGRRADGPGLGPVSAVGRSCGTKAWRAAGCPRCDGSRWRSRGRGCDINRPVRSRSGITGASAGGGAVTRRIGIVALARRVIIALWRYVEHGDRPGGRAAESVASRRRSPRDTLPVGPVGSPRDPGFRRGTWNGFAGA